MDGPSTTRRFLWIIHPDHEDIPFDQVLIGVVKDGEMQSVMICKPNEPKKEE